MTPIERADTPAEQAASLMEAMNALLVLMGQDNELSGAELYPLFDIILAELRRLCVRLERAA